jgi:fatty-acyl-CoA synthase
VCGGTRWTFASSTTWRPAGRRPGALGVAKGDRVAVLARNSHAFAALRFALARLGAVLVPINFMLKAEEAAYILRHAGAGVLATDSGLADLARAAAALDTQVKAVWCGCPPRKPPSPRRHDAFRRPGANARSPAPKSSCTAATWPRSSTPAAPSRCQGAMLTHDAVIWQYASCAVDASIAATDVMLHALPLYHCAQLDVFLGPMVYAGGHQRITGQADARQPAVADRAAPHHVVLRAAHGVDLAAALAAVRPRPTCPACARATTAPRSCRWRCCAS